MAICKCYDMDNQQCMGGPAWRDCKCEGDQTNCDFFPDIKRKAQKEPKQIEESKPDIENELKAQIKDLEMRLSDCIYDVNKLMETNKTLEKENQRLQGENERLTLEKEYLQGFCNAAKMFAKGTEC